MTVTLILFVQVTYSSVSTSVLLPGATFAGWPRKTVCLFLEVHISPTERAGQKKKESILHLKHLEHCPMSLSSGNTDFHGADGRVHQGEVPGLGH